MLNAIAPRRNGHFPGRTGLLRPFRLPPYPKHKGSPVERPGRAGFASRSATLWAYFCMSEQQKIKVGDTVVIRGEVLYVDRTIMAHNTKVIVSFKTKSGWAQAIHINHIDEVIPAPVIPKAGEVWTSNLGVGERHVTVLFADENGVYYERFGTINPPRGHLRLNMFLGRYGKDDGSD